MKNKETWYDSQWEKYPATENWKTALSLANDPKLWNVRTYRYTISMGTHLTAPTHSTSNSYPAINIKIRKWSKIASETIIYQSENIDGRILTCSELWGGIISLSHAGVSRFESNENEGTNSKLLECPGELAM